MTEYFWVWVDKLYFELASVGAANSGLCASSKGGLLISFLSSTFLLSTISVSLSSHIFEHRSFAYEKPLLFKPQNYGVGKSRLGAYQ
jgi:hypothetical protein